MQETNQVILKFLVAPPKDIYKREVTNYLYLPFRIDVFLQLVRIKESTARLPYYHVQLRTMHFVENRLSLISGISKNINETM